MSEVCRGACVRKACELTDTGVLLVFDTLSSVQSAPFLGYAGSLAHKY